jgi:anti-anti-sigma regulatory factor
VAWALWSSCSTARERGGRLCLAAAQRLVRNLLTITSVDQAIGVYDTVLAAEADMPPAVA